ALLHIGGEHLFTWMDVHGQIRDVLADTVRGDGHHGQRSLSEEDFIHALQRRGIVDDVMKDLHFTNVDVSHAKPDTVNTSATHFLANISPLRRYLYFQVLGGKAFLEHLQEPEPLPGQVCSTFTLHLHFRNQRFRSKPVPCACEPDLQEGFLLEVHRDGPGDASKMADATTMLSICDPVHMVLIKTDTTGDTTLISSYFLDWRRVLSAPNGKTSVSVELLGVGSECKVAVGVLNQSLERQKTAEKERLFLVYAKQWWQEFDPREIRPSHQSKLVKIFAQDENGVNRPVCSYVRVSRAGRLLKSPWQAVRFVSLLAQERAPVVGGGVRQEQWCSMMTFLCRNKGDHATLLCTKNIPHTWVMTCGTDGSITFWESFTTIIHVTLGCVFNHKTFLANYLYVYPAPPPLSPQLSLCSPSVVPNEASNQLELEMRYLLDLGLATVWDDHLSYLLSAAHSAYELEHCTGVSCGNEEFQDAVRRAVPDGHTFKGFPIHFLHRNARRAFATCLRSPFCEEIVCYRGDHVRLAVRVRVFAYPVSACAVWIMFACKYRSVL
uniref:Centrosomal protein 76 n=1 Tax=Sinocyclocheilus rhinocerous TaxID=307959 RepID=A0A673HZD4_9TELE